MDAKTFWRYSELTFYWFKRFSRSEKLETCCSTTFGEQTDVTTPSSQLLLAFEALPNNLKFDRFYNNSVF